MRFSALPLKGAFRIDLTPNEDSRGFFARVYCAEELAKMGLPKHWPQCNMSYSRARGTLRGLHFQGSPASEAKLVRCLRGAVFDVIVDLREGSGTFGQWHSEQLNEENRSMIFVPEGFAHGFQTLTDNVEMLYFHSAPYSAECQGGLRWNDPQVCIDWPLAISEMSPRDAALPLLTEVEPFAS